MPSVRSSSIWGAIVAAGPVVGLLIWSRMFEHVNSSIFGYDSDGPVFWAWWGPAALLAGTLGSALWYTVDGRHRARPPGGGIRRRP